MLHRGLLDPAGLTALLGEQSGRRGSRRARLAFSLADGRSRSPTSSHLRVRLVLGGLPRPEIEHPVPLAAGPVLLPDLAWPAYRVAIEYQAHRIALLTAAGWLVVHVPVARMRRDLPAVLREVRQALHRRGWQQDQIRTT
jgi:hypothetical protein